MTTQQRAIRGTKLILIVSALWLGVLGAGQAVAGGLLLYEVGTADVGLASAGWARGRRMPRPYSPTRPA